MRKMRRAARRATLRDLRNLASTAFEDSGHLTVRQHAARITVNAQQALGWSSVRSPTKTGKNVFFSAFD
ncbi:hypothetical protein [Streptomyces agglomeratus]|uniref:hypothetical protein n=1 Tax=Streptomyces agglomeratus TaxID=285458 RepID=UPI00114D1D7E|nr:hypothetical protein [Streptomyces agglomeratus]